MNDLFLFLRFLIPTLPMGFVWYDIGRITATQLPALRALTERAVSAEMWLSGVQAAVIVGVFLLLSVVFLVLLHLHWRGVQGKVLKLGFVRYLCVFLAIALGLPALWECFWLVIDFFTHPKSVVIDTQHLITALCVPYISLLALYRLILNFRYQKVSGNLKQPPVTRSKPAKSIKV